jgi:hypothetical protein
MNNFRNMIVSLLLNTGFCFLVSYFIPALSFLAFFGWVSLFIIILALAAAIIKIFNHLEDIKND